MSPIGASGYSIRVGAPLVGTSGTADVALLRYAAGTGRADRRMNGAVSAALAVERNPK